MREGETARRFVRRINAISKAPPPGTGSRRGRFAYGVYSPDKAAGGLPFPHSTIRHWQAAMALRAVAWLSGVTPAQQAARISIGVSG